MEGYGEIPIGMVLCGDGMLAPAVVVCRHLAEGESNDWRQVPEEITEPQECHDWVCPRCLADLLAVPVEDLRCVCRPRRARREWWRKRGR
jgi:hypothetical protein